MGEVDVGMCWLVSMLVLYRVGWGPRMLTLSNLLCRRANDEKGQRKDGLHFEEISQLCYDDLHHAELG